MAILAVVAIACSQLALAGHQFEHDFGNLAEACALCAGLQDLDVPPAPPPSFDCDRAPSSPVGTAGVERPGGNPPAPYLVRGPPRHL